MIIFIYGQDTFRSQRKLREIIEHYKKTNKSGLNLRYLNLKEKNFQDFKDEFLPIPMFGEKKLLILEEAFLNKDFKEKFVKNHEIFFDLNNADFIPTLSRQSRDVILFYEREEISKKDPFFIFLEKEAKSQRFDFLEGQKLKNWVKGEFKNLGGKIEEGAIEQLIDFVGSDTWQMSNEIKKLINYKNGEAVSEKDIEILVKPKIETDIFKTIDALASKNKKDALKLIHQHLEKGDNPSYLLSMVNFQFRNLLIIKTLSQKYQSFYPVAKVSGLHPFVVKKGYFQAQKFKIEELKKIYQKLFDADLAIKTGKINPETALDLLIAEI